MILQKSSIYVSAPYVSLGFETYEPMDNKQT